jgi:hypothetical protein
LIFFKEVISAPKSSQSRYNVQGESFPWVRQPGCIVNHSSPSSAEVMNEWSYTSTPPSLSLYSARGDSFTFLALSFNSFYASPQNSQPCRISSISFRLRPAPVPGYFLVKAALRKIFFDPASYSCPKVPFSSIISGWYVP